MMDSKMARDLLVERTQEEGETCHRERSLIKDVNIRVRGKQQSKHEPGYPSRRGLDPA